MYIAYQLLIKGREHDLNKEYKLAIDKYSQGIDKIFNELKKKEEKETDEILNKLQGYIKRVKELNNLVKNKNGLNFPQAPNRI